MIAIIDFGAGNLGSVYKAFRYIGADVEVTSDPAVVRRADALVLPGVGAFSHCMGGLAGVHLTQPTRDFIASGRPFLGICVGLQMLFDESEEMGASPGLGILLGKVVRFRFGQRGSIGAEEWGGRGVRDPGERVMTNGDCLASLAMTDAAPPNTQSPSDPAATDQRSRTEDSGSLKVPHIGWNAMEFRQDAALFRGLNPDDRVYFVHSYYPEPADDTIVSATTEYGYPFCCAVERGNVHATQFHPEKSGAVGLAILRNFASLAS